MRLFCLVSGTPGRAGEGGMGTGAEKASLRGCESVTRGMRCVRSLWLWSPFFSFGAPLPAPSGRRGQGGSLQPRPLDPPFFPCLKLALLSSVVSPF